MTRELEAGNMNMQKPIQNNLSKSSSVNYTTTRSGDPTPIIEIANNRVYPNSEGVYPQNCKIYKDESKK